METFEKILDPDDTSAGGGSASALAGAMAAALLAMAARLSKPSPDGGLADYGALVERGKALSARLREGADEDRRAFQAVVDAYRLPKGSEAERAARQRAVQEAWAFAAETPLANARVCLAALELGLEFEARLNPNVASDWSCGLRLARAGALGCLDNVAINLPNLKDAGLAKRLGDEAAAVRARLDAVPARIES
jgi:formiminotetrahydrofolate cyclodeaminase